MQGFRGIDFVRWRYGVALTPEERKRRNTEAHRRWRAEHPEAWAEANREAARRYVRRHPERKRARNILYRAIERGWIERPEVCPKCGEIGMVEAHHADYSEPFDVTWLCRPCHIAEHRKAA
jgi:ribosomal protein S27AE